MGVRGLTTYIKNHERKFLKAKKLHNCTVLLDGNSIAANLFIWSNIESAFGGDYDKYAKYVKEFFKLLKKCEIRPLVLFDGGYEQRKLKTVYSRLREKFRSACQAQPFTGSMNFPLFMRMVLREVLTEMEIPFAQSDFEADDELAALARQLNCPVLSYDSDFYIYDVLYIPLPTLSLIPVEFEKNGDSDTGPKYYLDCKIYSVEVFIESFGGLDKDMLPLLAALLGNDYIKRSIFKKFYTNLKIPKGKTNHLQRRIKAVIEWLRHETFESAVHKILSRMRKNHRRFVKRQLKRIVNGYVQCKSILSEYLGINSNSITGDSSVLPDESDNPKVNWSVVNIIEQINVESMEDEPQPDEDDDSVISSEEDDSDAEYEDVPDNNFAAESIDDSLSEKKETSNKITLCNGNSTEFPCWLLDLARRGKIQSCIFDILSLQQYFFPPQVEDFSLPPSHLVSMKILNAIVGLLHGGNGNLVKYWTRSGSQLTSYFVEPVLATPNLQFPLSEKIPDINENLRKAALLDIADSQLDLSKVPEDWHLFLVAVVFWLKNMKQPAPTEAYLHTMVMCLVGIYSIDSSIGVYRNRQTFMRKYRNFLNKVIEARSRDKLCARGSKPQTEADNNEVRSLDITKQFKNVSTEDCVLIFETLLSYHHVSEQVKMKPKLFCLPTVHAFAQFQSSLFHLMILNSILEFPFRDCVISKIFSGTFVYNIFQNFSKRNNIKAYVETLLRPSPSLLKMYMMLVDYLQNSLNSVNLLENPAKTRRKKKKQNKEIKPEEENMSLEDEEGEVYVDDNNRFSGLCLNAS